MYPALPKSYKGIFPFKIGTTSFIYPDGYVQNVKMLAPYLDEIEMLLFESTPNSLPSNHEIKELFSLSKEFDFSYNIHLPLDISLGVKDSSMRHSAIETIKQVMDLTAPLSPTSYTLHLPYGESDTLCSFCFNSRIISIETLNYPFEWVEDILKEFNLSVCMDLGHLILYELDMKDVFNRYRNRISIIHLHGANENKDHQPLDLLSKSNLKAILRMLKQFMGTVSIEVFSFDHLNASLKYLESVWKKHKV